VSDSPPADPQILHATPRPGTLEQKVARRRTFAIISHPGAVRGRESRRYATSAWMKLEQKPDISITSAALDFELQGRRLSLLDTPGHMDFSEDTYRALIAADSLVRVIDAANGVEDQTRKLRSADAIGCRFSPSSTSWTARHGIRWSCLTT
jgi:peptide chain release factor 3